MHIAFATCCVWYNMCWHVTTMIYVMVRQVIGNYADLGGRGHGAVREDATTGPEASYIVWFP